MSPIYTKAGDQGSTGILGEGRFSKNEIRFDALGALDEATAVLGIARATTDIDEIKDLLLQLQKKLYQVMSEISSTAKTADTFRSIDNGSILWLEETIERLTNVTGSPKDFIVPGETLESAFVSHARAIIRRAERAVVAMDHDDMIYNPLLLTFLNRASSFCFALELYINQIHGIQTRKIKEI